jgi:hypothetical protein
MPDAYARFREDIDYMLPERWRGRRPVESRRARGDEGEERRGMLRENLEMSER